MAIASTQPIFAPIRTTRCGCDASCSARSTRSASSRALRSPSTRPTNTKSASRLVSALDFMGREIILLDQADVQVAGTPSPSPGVIFGNFLVIAYAEQRVQPVSDGCVATSAAGGCGGNLAWGAPTRIRAVPKLQMVDTWPNDQSGRIVLAQIGLQAGCQVSEIQCGVCRYAVAAQPPTVHRISLEGEKDIDSSNPKTLYFHVDGGVPDSGDALFARRRVRINPLHRDGRPQPCGRTNHSPCGTLTPRALGPRTRRPITRTTISLMAAKRPAV
jgi:hypothetical protein